MASLKGWKTYLVFGATAIIAISVKLGWAEADGAAVGKVVDLLTDPLLLSIVGVALRELTKTPAAL